MKDEILNILNMNDILDKYNIKRKGSQFCCPFHGEDKSPSAKAYDKTFYCFACNKTGDLIQFVQYLFNLNFKEAMQKINEDFNLGLDSNTKIDLTKIIEIEAKRKQKQLAYETLENRFKELCNTKFELKHKIQNLNSNIKTYNWELKTFPVAIIQDKIGKIEIELDQILDEMYRIKNS